MPPVVVYPNQCFQIITMAAVSSSQYRMSCRRMDLRTAWSPAGVFQKFNGKLARPTSASAKVLAASRSDSLISVSTGMERLSNVWMISE